MALYKQKTAQPLGIGQFCSWLTVLLLLQEAGLKHDAAAVDLAVNLGWVLGQANALNLCTTLNNHR